jgi:hypothetical protein
MQRRWLPANVVRAVRKGESQQHCGCANDKHYVCGAPIAKA